MLDSWFFWALGTALVWGVGQVVAKKSLNLVSPLAYNFLSSVLGLFIYLPFALSLGVNFRALTLVQILLLIFINANFLLYYYVISSAPLALAGSVISASPLTTIFFSMVLLGERPGLFKLLFCLLILSGVILIGLAQTRPQTRIPDLTDRDPGSKKRSKSKKWFWLAVAVSTLIGFSDYLAKFLVGDMGVGNYFLVYTFAAFLPLLVSYGLDKKGRRVPRMALNLWVVAVFGGVLMVLGNLFFFNAFARGPASLVSPIASSYQAITVVLALIFLKEKLRGVQAAGVALTVLGIILIGAF